MDKEILRDRFLTFNTQQEVCDALGITVEDILLAFDEHFDEYVDEETDTELEEEEGEYGYNS